MLHGTCVGEDARARKTVFFREKWLPPAGKGWQGYLVCAFVAATLVVMVFLPQCTGGSKLLLQRSSVRSYWVFWNLWFFRLHCNGCVIVVMFCCHVLVGTSDLPPGTENALQWLHDCCMGHVLRRMPELSTLTVFLTHCIHSWRDGFRVDIVLGSTRGPLHPGPPQEESSRRSCALVKIWRPLPGRWGKQKIQIF